MTWPEAPRRTSGELGLTQDDVRAMKRQGDLSTFLRQQIRSGATRRVEAAKPVAVVSVERPAGHVPGAWPAGTRPSSMPRQELTPAEIEAALRQYREWAARTSPDDQARSRVPCPCLGCRMLATAEGAGRRHAG